MKLLHQVFARRVDGLAAADRLDHLVEDVERTQQAFDDVGAFARLAQVVLRAAADDLLAVLDEELQHALEAEQPRVAIDQRQHLHAKGLLQRRVLEEVGEHILWLDGARQLDDDAHPRAVGLVAQVADALDLAIAHQVGDALDQRSLVGLVGQLGDDDARAPAADLLEVRLGLDDQPRLAHRIALGDGVGVILALAFLAVAIEDAAGGEVRPLDKVHQLFAGDVVDFVEAVDHKDQRIDDLAQVVRRDVGRHADGDAAGAVDEQVGQRGGHDIRLAQRVVEVVVPLDGLFFQVFEHEVGQPRQPRLGVAHGRGVVAVDAAEVALPVDQRVAQAEGLRHAHHRIVDRGVAVRVILAEHLADDACALLVRLVVGEREVVPHRVENAAVHRLQPIAHIGQRARHDHAHGVVEIRGLHLLRNVGGADKAGVIHVGGAICAIA